MILLATLLPKYDLPGAILEDPYFAITHTLGEWVEHLVEGMERWEEKMDEPIDDEITFDSYDFDLSNDLMSDFSTDKEYASDFDTDESDYDSDF